MPSRIQATLGLLLLTVIAFGCAPLPYTLHYTRDNIVPVDVVLETNVAFVDQAAAGTSQMVLVRSFVRGNDLLPVQAQVARVMSMTNLADVKLTATGVQSGNASGPAGTAIVVHPSQELRRLEERMVEALRPLWLNPETAMSFIVTADGSKMSDDTMESIEGFVPAGSGVNFRPHIIVSQAQADAAKRISSQPDAVTIGIVGASIYQLGGAGTPQRRLWTWTGEVGSR